MSTTNPVKELYQLEADFLELVRKRLAYSNQAQHVLSTVELKSKPFSITQTDEHYSLTGKVGDTDSAYNLANRIEKHYDISKIIDFFKQILSDITDTIFISSANGKDFFCSKKPLEFLPPELSQLLAKLIEAPIKKNGISRLNIVIQGNQLFIKDELGHLKPIQNISREFITQLSPYFKTSSSTNERELIVRSIHGKDFFLGEEPLIPLPESLSKQLADDFLLYTTYSEHDFSALLNLEKEFNALLTTMQADLAQSVDACEKQSQNSTLSDSMKRTLLHRKNELASLKTKIADQEALLHAESPKIAHMFPYKKAKNRISEIVVDNIVTAQSLFSQRMVAEEAGLTPDTKRAIVMPVLIFFENLCEILTVTEGVVHTPIVETSLPDVASRKEAIKVQLKTGTDSRQTLITQQYRKTLKDLHTYLIHSEGTLDGMAIKFYLDIIKEFKQLSTNHLKKFMTADILNEEAYQLATDNRLDTMFKINYTSTQNQHRLFRDPTINEKTSKEGKEIIAQCKLNLLNLFETKPNASLTECYDCVIDTLRIVPKHSVKMDKCVSAMMAELKILKSHSSQATTPSSSAEAVPSTATSSSSSKAEAQKFKLPFLRSKKEQTPQESEKPAPLLTMTKLL